MGSYQTSSREYYRQRVERLREEKATVKDTLIFQYGGIPCLECNGIFEWCAMDFDHRPDETKEFNISRMNSNKATARNMNKIMKEIDKCDLICSNCHRVRTQLRKSFNSRHNNRKIRIKL